jgi:hypothetical protein
MSEPNRDPDQPRLWQVKIAFLATPAEHEKLVDQLAEVLCPDPEHAGPCATPWALRSVDEDGLSAKKRAELRREIDDTNP